MKIDVACFRYRDYPAEAMDAIHDAVGQLVAAGHSVKFPRYGNALIHASRNAAIAARRPDVDYLIMIDDDMLPEPGAFLKLIAHRAPVVSALCTTRSIPAQLCLNIWNDEAGYFSRVDWANPDNLYVGKFAVGAACLCLSGAVIDELVEQYLSADDWLEQNKPMLDRMEVSAARRRREQTRIEGIRREQYAENPGSAWVFSFDTTDGQDNLGEDISLGYRLKWLDRNVLIDPSIQVDHGGLYRYGLKDVAVPPDKQEVQVAA